MPSILQPGAGFIGTGEILSHAQLSSTSGAGVRADLFKSERNALLHRCLGKDARYVASLKVGSDGRVKRTGGALKR